MASKVQRKTGYKHLNMERFNAAKAVLRYGVKVEEVENIFNMSYSTVMNIKRYDTYEEYQAFLADRLERRKQTALEPTTQPEAEPMPSSDIPSSFAEKLMEQNRQIMGQQSEIIEKMERFSNLFEDTSTEPKKRTLFNRG